MTNKGFGILLGTLFTLAAVSAFGAFKIASANPSLFLVQNTGVTTTATTSVVYMTAGTATTTKYFDAGAGGAQAADGAVLFLQLTGSSTATSLNVAYEYARGSGANCITTPTACDWYASNLSAQATTSPQQNITTAQDFQFAFASTTQGKAVGTGDGRVLKTIVVPTPTRYVRAILTLPVGSLNGAVWAEFVGKRQAAN